MRGFATNMINGVIATVVGVGVGTAGPGGYESGVVASFIFWLAFIALTLMDIASLLREDKP